VDVCVFSPGVHPVVNERVDHGVGHGEPVEGQEEVLHVLGEGDRAVVVRVDEVGVVRQPAHGEDQHDDDEHPHHLKHTNQTTLFLSFLRHFLVYILNYKCIIS